MKSKRVLTFLRVTNACVLGGVVILLAGFVWFISTEEDLSRFIGDKKYFLKIYMTAVKGDAAAQQRLALLYSSDIKYRKSAKWMRRAANQEDAKSQHLLGLAYRNGQGVAQDHAEAAKWYLKAAENGYPRAIMKLGEIYRKGQGVPQDYSEAAK